MSLQGAGITQRIERLVGSKRFVRRNPKTDLFDVNRFHHIEFWCPDATNAYKRFQLGLGMSLVAKSDQETGNGRFGSYVLKSDELVFAFTAPYSSLGEADGIRVPQSTYSKDTAFQFLKAHGMGVRAIGVSVGDAEIAFEASVKNGAIPVTSPIETEDVATGSVQKLAEVSLYGDAVLRYVSGDFRGPYLADYSPVKAPGFSYGLNRLDHAVGNVPNLLQTANYVAGFTGFHEFAEFTAEDVGTVDSGLNSLVLANNNEFVMLPLNEPTFGTKRKSQIQTYLEQNEGAGVQHLALKTNDIISCIRKMKAVSDLGGFEFMPRPSDEYYRRLPARIGNALSSEQYQAVEELGILVDKDDQGVLLQIFTKPVSDRATLFLEIIQRVGCEQEVINGDGLKKTMQAAGCGGFGKGNFSELFRSIENYERNLVI
eukprot:g5951.t1